MSMALNGSSTIPVRNMVTKTGSPVTSTNVTEQQLKDVLIAVFSAIPNQADATATVAAIVTTLKTLP